MGEECMKIFRAERRTIWSCFTAGLPHFLREETSSTMRVIIVPNQQYLTKKACITWEAEKSKKDKKIVMYKILHSCW